MSLFRNAAFVTSVAKPELLPASAGAEIAFAGRSNAGKSSAINTLVSHTRLAFVSKTPGRTQLINFFRLPGGAYLVDLPGYGFAKVSMDERAAWRKMIDGYLLERENLQCVFVLIDSRLEPQNNDLGMIKWLGEKEIPFVLVFTKSDKMKQPSLVSHIALFKRTLKKTWDKLPQIFITSSESRKGREDLLEFIAGVNAQWRA